MKRIQVPSQGVLTKAAINFFLTNSSTPFFIQLIFLVMEALLYTSMVSSLIINAPIAWAMLAENQLMAILIGALFIRCLFGITMARLIYVPCALSALSLKTDIGTECAVWGLLLLNVAIQVLSRIQFEFVSQNPFSQTINHTKILHYGACLISMALKFKFSSRLGDLGWICELVNLILFVLLAVIKLQSSVRSQVVKQMMMRLYLLSVGYYARNLITNWSNSIDLTHQHVLVIVISQLGYSLAKYKYGKIQMDTEISNGNIVNLVFSIMSYSYSCAYDTNFQDIICQLSLDKNDPSFPVHQPSPWAPNYKKGSIMSNIQQSSPTIKKVSLKMQQLLKDDCQQKQANQFSCLFLLIQIKFNAFANVVVSKKMIAKLKQQCSCIQWIDRLCLYKFQEKLHQEIKNNYEINELCHFEDFLQNQKLRTMIIKHSYEYLSLWKYTNNPNFLFEKLTKMFVKIIQRRNQINKLFNAISVKCSTVILLFIDYLYMVRRDVPEAIKICRGFQIYEEANYLLKLEDKIYMCVSLQHNNMLNIHNVSYNVKKLLGYEKFAIRHANVGLLLPSFFAEAHQKLVTKIIFENNGNYYVMKKRVIVKHFDGYYLPAILELKMVYNNQGCLMMEGFLQVLQDNSYNWTNYFFVKHDEGELIQIGPSLKNLIELNPRKFVHINEYFQSKSEETQTKINNQKQLCNEQSRKYLYSNGIQYQYDFMKNIFSNQVNHSYYVCKNNLFDMPSEIRVGGIPEKFEQYLSQFLKFQKYPVRYEDFQTNLEQYFAQKGKAMAKFQQKAPFIIFVIILIIFLGIFVIQALLIQRVSVTKQNNDEIKQDMNNLIQFYHSLQNMGAIVNSFSLYDPANRQRFFIYDYYQIPELCLTLQKMNERLIKFDVNQYGQEGGTVDNSAKPLRQLVSDYISNFYMNLYVPDLQLLTMSKLAVHTYSEYIFGDGLDDYLSVFRDQIIQFRDQDQRVKLSLSICICAMIAAVYVLMYKIDTYEREYQYQSLNLISNINAKPIFINSVSEFIRRAAGGVNENQAIEKQGKLKKSNSTTLMSQGNSRIQMSSNVSARQNSVRGLFEEQVLSSTNRDHRKLQQINATMPFNTLEMKERIEQDETERKQLKMRPRSKGFILGWTILIGVIIGIAVIGMISDQSVNKIELPKSMLGLSTILNKQILFSSMVNSYIQNLVSKDRQDLFDLNNKKFMQLQAVQTIFEETSSPQFANFTDILQKVTYSYICEYNDCNATYKDFINIIYFSAVHKLNQFMVDNPTVKFDAPGRFSVAALFYAHYMLESIIYKLLKSYLSDYNSFEYKKLTIYFALYFSQISVLVVCLAVSLALYIWHFRNERNKCYAILDLIKKQSYMIKETSND